MPLHLAFRDGTTLYGTNILTINGLQFFVNDQGASGEIDVKDVLNEVGAPRKAVGVQQKQNGSYTIQLDSADAILSCSLATSMSISASDTPSGSAFHAWITGRELARSNEGFATMTLSWQQKLNA